MEKGHRPTGHPDLILIQTDGSSHLPTSPRSEQSVGLDSALQPSQPPYPWWGAVGAGSLNQFFFFFLISFFLYIFLAALDPRCCAQAFSSCGKWLLSSCSAQASHCSGFSCCGARALDSLGFSSCGAWAQPLHSTWDLPGPGIEPVSPALAGGFFTTESPVEPHHILFICSSFEGRMSCFTFALLWITPL